MEAPLAPHPNDEALHAYGLGKLGAAAASAVDMHLEACEACRQRVSELSGDSFLGRLRGAGMAAPAPARSSGPPSSGGLPESTRTQAPVSPPDLAGTLPPELTDNAQYEVLHELGRGGMGVVYLARNKLMDRLEVLKVLNKEMLERKGTYDRFIREIRAAARLSHPNVVAAHAALQIGGLLVFAMEYVEGQDLSRLVRARGPLPVAHACSFVSQAALGLQHAHERGMVHRDIKPGNLMLMRQGQRGIVKVLDFGLAKATSENPIDGGLTREGQMLGTPDYIAPEQTLNAQKADIRADIYSLGCTFYYLLTGGPPFRGASLYEILQAHHSIEARPLNLVRPEVPLELAVVVAKMMAKEPARRYQTPREVAAELKPFYKSASAGPADRKPAVSETQADPEASDPVLAGASPATVTAAAEKPPGPEVRWESLIAVGEPEQPSHQAAAVAPPVRVGRPWAWSALAAGALLLGFVVAWAAGVFLGKMRDRVLVRENLPELENGREPKAAEIDQNAGEALATVAPKPPAASLASTGTSTAVLPAEPIASLPAADNPRPLFNGKNLSGWLVERGDPETWRIVDEVLVARPTINDQKCLLLAEGRYSDFLLRFEFQVSEDAHGGVVLRAEPGEPLFPFHLTLQSAGTPDRPRKWIVTAQRADSSFRKRAYGPVDLKPEGSWNLMEIEMRAGRWIARVNGKRIVDAQRNLAAAKTEGNPSFIRSSGHLGFMIEKGTIQFRKIAVEGPSASLAALGEEVEKPARATVETPVPEPTAGPVKDAGTPAALTADGFQPLFNGRDLQGWKTHPLRKGQWSVESGVLVGRGSDESLLFTDEADYTHFHARLEAKISAAGFGGFGFRTKFFGSGAFQGNGYKAAINDPKTPWKTGSLMYFGGLGQAKQMLVQPDEWFRLEVIMVGYRIIIKVNGITTIDYVDLNRTYPEGHLALQQVNAGTEISFRRVEVKRLALGANLREIAGVGPPRLPAIEEFMGKTYLAVSQQFTWKEARDRCLEMGGHLAIVTDAQQNAFVTQLLTRRGIAASWLGATDEVVEGKWLWVDGSPLRYRNWDSIGRQPNNGGGIKSAENYMALLVRRNGAWCDQSDLSLVERPGFVCQWD